MVAHMHRDIKNIFLDIIINKTILVSKEINDIIYVKYVTIDKAIYMCRNTVKTKYFVNITDLCHLVLGYQLNSLLS